MTPKGVRGIAQARRLPRGLALLVIAVLSALSWAEVLAAIAAARAASG